MISFAKLIEPNVEPTEIFPNFQSKLEQSLSLRQALWEILQAVKKAEQNPETYPLDSLHTQLIDFLGLTLQFLF